MWFNMVYNESIIDSKRWRLWCYAKVVYLIFLWRWFSRPEANSWISSRSWKLILLKMILFLWWFLRQNMMGWIFKEFITCKGLVRLRQRAIISILSIKSFTWLNGRMRLPFPFIFGWCYSCSHIVSSGAW